MKPPIKLLCLLAITSFQAKADEKPIMRFIQISDSQIVDEESPARLVLLDHQGKLDAAWRPQEAYGLQALDLSIQKIREIHETRPIDFVIQTGDAVDSAQYNELRWFIDTMDGKWIDPDSGEKDGFHSELPPDLNPNLPFQAQGLPSDIPWYTVYGNHDSLSVGNFAIVKDTVDAISTLIAPLPDLVVRFAGLESLKRKFLDSQWNMSPAIITAKEDYALPGSFKLNRALLKAGFIAPDENRRFLTRKDFIEEHLYPQSTSLPHGHGFTETNVKSGKLYYSFRPNVDVPLRLIVLDSIPEQPAPCRLAFHGMLSFEQFEYFVKPEVAKALKAGESIIFVSHHPSRDFDGAFGALETEISQTEWRRYVSSQPHVLAHITGHSHKHAIEKVKEGAYPYVEITTGAIIDSPQEFRVFEVYKGPNGKLSMRYNETVGFMSLAEEKLSRMAIEISRRASFDGKRRGLIQNQSPQIEIPGLPLTELYNQVP